MATYTANHLYLSAVLKATSGIWNGESAVWGWRFANGGGAAGGRPGLNDGIFTLNTFDVHTSITSRALTISSKAGTVSQTWEGDSIPDTETVTPNDIDFFLTKGGDFFGQVLGYLPNTWALDSIRLYPTNKDGKAPAGPTIWQPTTAWIGADSAQQSPEVAMCVSHYTTERSRRGRGRLYFGPLGSTTFYLGSGIFAAALITNVGAAAAALQTSVRTRGTPGSSATYAGVVWNRKGDSHGSDGTLASVINKVRVGDEPDRQERRTKKRPETYVNWTIT